jgi:lantibiotic leader peptide-processing serine protease
MTRRIIFSIAAVLAVGACSNEQNTAPSDPSTEPSVALAKASSPTYVIGFSAQAGDVKAAIERAGGKVRNLSKRAGLGTAESADLAFADKLAKMPGIRGVAMDTVVQWVPAERVVEASHGSNETFFRAQWAPPSIHADAALDAGATGSGARVAVLDGGLNNTHIDLDGGTVDVAHSTSFVPGFAFNQDANCGTPSCFSHATHVAGIIAAEDDGVGTIGIAPGATIIGVKVLHGGSGSFGAIIDGIIYAANPLPVTATDEPGANADIINMSLGAQFPSGRDSKVRALTAFLNEATDYAYEQGTLVIASAGNGDKKSRGIDHDLGQWFTLPAQASHVVGVSSLGPVGFALNPPIPTSDDFDRLASYSNFGVRIVDFSGPGGDFVLPGSDVCSLPRVPTGSITTFCWVFDMVLSPASIRATPTSPPANGGYSWAAGTSMSAPAVAGVAALVVGTRGHMSPGALFNRLKDTADDLGAPGVDRVHGNGRVNALRAATE